MNQSLQAAATFFLNACATTMVCAAAFEYFVPPPIAVAQVSSEQTTPSSSTNSQFDYTAYPRVNRLEEELFGRTYTNESLQQRLSRLEVKAFGKPDNASDLAVRVDVLEDYADRHDLYGDSAAQPTGSIVPFTSSATDYYSRNNTEPSNNSSPSSFVGSPAELVSIMESQEFSRTYTDRPLLSRIKKLERYVFNGKVNTNQSLPQRVANLWDTLHPNEKQEAQTMLNGAATNPVLGANGTESYASKTGHHSWLHGLAKGVGVVAGGLARGMMYGGYGGYGYGYPYGYGMGMGSYGMGGYGMYPYGYGMGMSGMGMSYGMYRPYGYW